jgi:hypothetical protein
LKLKKNDILFVIGTSLAYCMLSAAFSFVGTVLPEKTFLISPIEHGSLNIKEIFGHFIWGFVAGMVILRIRYILLGGLFALLIDSDHLVGLMHMSGLPRMSHSIIFAILSLIVLMILFGKKDYRLGVIAATSVLTHISYDVFDSEMGFPILTPFINTIIQFPRIDWIFFEIIAIIIIGIINIIVIKKECIQKNTSIE